MKKIVILAVIFIAVIAIGYKTVETITTRDIISLEDAKAKAEKFINDNLMQPGTQATVREAVEEKGLYKIVLEVGGQEYDSYLTKDGSKFFPQALDVVKEEESDEGQAQEQSAEPQVSVKSARPVIELFVMSYCPYGTQIEKGILPVLEALGDKIDFKLKFCDYAMHDKIELDEQLAQYCIQKEEPAKLLGYLSTFLEDGDSAAAINKAGIDTAKLNSCVASIDKEFKVTEKYNDQTTWLNGLYPTFDVYKADNEKYGITGSPAMVINGQKIGSSRNASALLSVICSGFDNPPAECSQQLSATTPSPGFGFSGSSNDSSGSCN